MGAKPSAPLAPPRPPLISSDAVMLLALAAPVLAFALLGTPAQAGGLSSRRVLSLCACLLAGATLALSAIEGLGAVDSFYLSCMTFTTIGYGDLPHPATAAGRALVGALALGGVGFFGVALEHVHGLRGRADGAVLGRLGMLVMNVLGGLAICAVLADDPGLPDGLLDGAYWAVITTSSVGFGDFHPTTTRGKLAVCAYSLLCMQATANAMDIAKEALVRLCTVPDAPKRD
jgi:hypothetical protein